MAIVAIALGTNLGNRTVALRRAVEALGRSVTIVAESKIYETEPMYVRDQPPFLNAAILVSTAMGPLRILRLLKETEGALGRGSAPRFGPREIDLDLITYGQLRYRFFPSDHGEPELVVPHPRLAERRFVLQPLFDLDPNLQIPSLGSIADLLRATDHEAETVREMSDALLPLLSH